MAVSKELLVGSHPVTEGEVKERGKLKLLEDILGEALIVHGWESVAVEKENLLDDVQDDERGAGNWEQDGHTETIDKGDESDGHD